jgi:uncharacterized lipoprotein YajG
MLRFIKTYHYISLIIITSLIISGCAGKTSGTGPARTLALEPDYKYRIGEINTSEAKEYEIDTKEMLRRALEKALTEKDMLWNGSSEQKHYDISLRITEYEMGNAFKRWLLPTYGSTVLGVHTDIVDAETSQIITSMERKQTIAAGGLYSVGAWKYVFDVVAKEIAVDLQRRFSGTEDAFIVQLDPWLEKETEAPKSTGSITISLLPFQDMRSEKIRIGERKALNVSMGDVFANRDVSIYIREAVQNELLASGNSLSDDENSDIIVSGELVKFWVQTPSTPLYWDIIGEIELKLTARTRGEDNKVVEKTYRAKSQDRTYVWPTEKLLTKVVSDTVRSLMYEIRKDSIWTTL